MHRRAEGLEFEKRASSLTTFIFSSMCAAGIYSSYLICTGCIAWRRVTKQTLLPSRLSLGQYSLFVNLVAIAFQGVQFVFLFWPNMPHPTVPNLNGSLLVYGVVIVWALAYFHLWEKNEYRGPVEYVRKSE
jgi:choline transport protein